MSQSPQSKEDIDAPTFLAARLEKLISFGLIEDATELLQSVKTDAEIPSNYDLSLVDLQLTLLNGSLAPICLDIQASSNDYRDMPAWRELSEFCRLRFGSTDKISMNDVNFKNYPDLKSILQSDTVNMSQLRSSMGTLVAFNDNRISEQSYNKNARNVHSLSDLTVKLAMGKSFKQYETHQCYAIEAAKRGIIDKNALESLYKEVTFDSDALGSLSGEIAMHPCLVPAYFYQRLSASDDLSKNQLTDVMLQSTQSMPAQALLPMIDYIKDYQPNKESQWRAAIVMGANKEQLSDSYQPLAPLIKLQKSESIAENTYMEWLKSNNNDTYLKRHNIDLAFLPYISQTLAAKNINFTENNKKQLYGKLFSLTYAKKSLDLSLGFNDFIAENYDDDNHAMVISQILATGGHHDIQNLN